MNDFLYDIFRILETGVCIYSDYEMGILGILNNNEINIYFRINDTDQFEFVKSIITDKIPDNDYAKILVQRAISEEL